MFGERGLELERGKAKKRDRAVGARGGQEPVVGRENHRPLALHLGPRQRCFRPVAGAPESDAECEVVAHRRGDEVPAAVRKAQHAPELAGNREVGYRLSPGPIPERDARRAIARGEPMLIRRQGYGPVVAPQGGQVLDASPRAGIPPREDTGVFIGHDEAAGVCRKGQAEPLHDPRIEGRGLEGAAFEPTQRLESLPKCQVRVAGRSVRGDCVPETN